MKPNICIFDSFTTDQGTLSWSSLQLIGNVDVYARTSTDQILKRGTGKEILITNKVFLSRETISQLPDCKLICLLSTGTNAVDLEACHERGIPVCNIPAYSSNSVAELVFAFLLEWARGVSQHAQAVREGDWIRQQDFCFLKTPQVELSGKTLGLVGFGDIAQTVCRMAVAWGIKVIAFTPHPEGKPELGQQFVSEDTVYTDADFISLHCPLNPQTDQMINAERLGSMKSGAVLINTGRGGLLDEVAVADALNRGQLGAACLDVLSTEPPLEDNPLLDAANVCVTPHIGWATTEARTRLIEILTGNVQAFLAGCPRNVVNGL